ncbi:MAG: hypothetical protein M5R40_28435 [Anaerolineae bacterium]|nr:hypothetical protein [Anaerolineae bacterium]
MGSRFWPYLTIGLFAGLSGWVFTQLAKRQRANRPEVTERDRAIAQAS